MWDVGSADYHIFRLDLATQTWTDTGVALDDRPSTRADVLWDAAQRKLYVASHKFNDSTSAGHPSRLYRYSYNANTGTYTRDAGFPVSINNFRLETLVVDKDSTGKLWATWVQGGKVWVNATVCSPGCNDANWGTAFAISVADVSADDISSVVAFGGDRIGVMWSNQNTDTDYFAVHRDGDPDDVWAVETALQGSGMADDHINLKADAGGRVYAAVKTSKTASGDPLTMLLVRSAGGNWSSHVFGTVGNNHTRPIVEIDEQHGVVHMLATSSGTGGSIMEKTSPLDSISFVTGMGTAVITDAGAKVNDASSTKQNVSSTTGLVVAAHSSNRVYFHAYDSLSGGALSPPVANFTAAPSTGTAPLTVDFTDTSTGTVDSWAWDYENDGIIDATSRNATATYATPNTYTAKLTVTNAAGASSKIRTITVTEPGGGGSTQTFAPNDDAYVRSASPNTMSGGDSTLRVFGNATSETESYLRFVVSGVGGSAVTSAILRLFVTDGSLVSGSVYGVPETPWSESTLTWNTKPAVGSWIAGPKSAPLGTWVEFDLTAAVDADGTYTFALKDGAATTWYSSKEGANAPELVLTVGS